MGLTVGAAEGRKRGEAAAWWLKTKRGVGDVGYKKERKTKEKVVGAGGEAGVVVGFGQMRKKEVKGGLPFGWRRREGSKGCWPRGCRRRGKGNGGGESEGEGNGK